MSPEALFEKLEQHYQQSLPFVVYSRPINSIIKCWLQQDAILNETVDFSEEGFVFAPFNLQQKTILFRADNSEHYSVETHSLDVEPTEDNDYNAEVTLKDEHIKLVQHGISSIENGILSKVVVSRQIEVEVEKKNPLAIFKRLFNSYKNAMVYCWYHPKVGLWLGATPELLFKVEGQNMTTISLAGTKPYEEDREVQWTHKEIEEQKIVTDFISEQITPFSATIKVNDLEVVRAGKLLHLKTRILAHLKSGFDLKSIVEALHPTPAVCGFPKDAAKAFILENENYDRNYYTGFLGELNLLQSSPRNRRAKNVENQVYKTVKRHSNFYVNLRCMQLQKDRAYIYVGGGITKNSNAEEEWEETVSKSRTMLSIL